MTDLAVVIPTVDRVALLSRCLDGLAKQPLDGVEVLVVHDGHAGVEALLRDRTEDGLPIHALRIDATTAAAKRNAGWRATDAPVVAFVDDDCEPAPGWLDAARAALVDGVDLVQGRVLPHPDDGDVTGVFKRTLLVDAPTEQFPNANLVYRRSALARVGGFDERIWGGGEDADLAWRVLDGDTSRVAWAPDALVWHAVRPAGLVAHVKSLPRWSTLALVLRKHPDKRRLLHKRLFWKRSHPTGLLALAGLVLALLDRRALALALPLLARRVRELGVRDGAQVAAADVVEVGVMLYGSGKHRSVIL